MKTPSAATIAGRDRGAAPGPAPRLEELVPIAVVIAAGCEPCARRMVRRALAQGSAVRDVRKTVALVAHMRRQACLEEALGAAAVGRMDAPLAAARATLEAGGAVPAG